MKLPKVAVVILNWNGKSLLQQFLPSVLSTTYANTEIVLADNASSDDSVEFVKKTFPSITIVQNKENFGFAGGYNLALKKVEADYVVLLNSDVEVTPNWLEPLVEMAEKNPKIAAIQPKVLAQKNKQYFEYAGAAGGYMDAFGFPFCRGRMFDVCEKDEAQYQASQEVFWASGCALFIQSELYHRFGGLDADFFAHMEEIDLCWRLKNAGYQVFVEPKSIVYHVGGATLSAESPRKTYLNFRNNWSMLLKNERAVRLLYVIPIRAALDTVAAYRLLFQGNFAAWFAILKAHLYVLFKVFFFWKKRTKTQELVAQNRLDIRNETGRYRGSIVWAFFAQSKKRFSDLAHHFFA